MANLSNGFVCLMGIGTVFIGLICIVFLCQAMSAIIMHFEKGSEARGPSEEQVAEIAAPIENRQELVAAISAVLAEEMGEEVTALRILSIKKI